MSTFDYIVAVSFNDATALSRLRCFTDVEVCVESTDVWVRGSQKEADVYAALRALPGRQFVVNDDSGLIPSQRVLVERQMPDGPWQSVRHWLTVEVPRAGWAGKSELTVPLQLENSTAVRSASAVLTSIEQIVQFADSALDLRLQQLKFAMKASGEVLVIGTPLPSVSGQRFWIENDVAVPAGQSWTPQVDAATVRQTLTDQPGIVLWLSTDHWELIPPDAFTAATRSSLRASLAAQPEPH